MDETQAGAADEVADIVLAECSGQAWLVRGEQHIDDLLGNTLSPHVSIEIISCETKSAVDGLWRRFGGDADEDMMWLIHPAVVNRARGPAGALSVSFGEWSAGLDDSAVAVLQAAADAAVGGATLVLVRHVAADATAMAAALADLRSGVLEARLAALGVPADRMVRETAPVSEAGQGDRVDLVIKI